MFTFCSPSVLWLNPGFNGAVAGAYAERDFFAFWDFAVAGGFFAAAAFVA